MWRSYVALQHTPQKICDRAYQGAGPQSQALTLLQYTGHERVSEHVSGQ